MSIKIKNFIFPVFSFFFCFAGNVFAEGEGYSLLAPIPTVAGGSQPDLVTYLKGLFTLAVGLSIVFAVFVIIYGGVKYTLAIVPGAKSDAKKRMTDAVLGLFIVLISSILLNTLNPGLLNIGLKLEDVQFDATTEIGTTPGTTEIKQYCFTDPVTLEKSNCYDSISTCQAMLIVHNPLGTVDNCMMYESTVNTNPEDETHQYPEGTGTFGGTGVTVAQGISVEGLRSDTINEISRTKAACDCAIVVTSTTGGSHNCSLSSYNHCTGYKADLGMNPKLDAYIRTNYTKIQDRGDGAPQYKAPDGAIYADETNLGTGPHWDVLVK